MKKYVVGARGSKLSLNQTRRVLEEIKKANLNFDYEIKNIKTSGDYDKESNLEEVSNKNFFTDNIEKSLLNKEIDIAIHSMKDLSSVMDPNLVLADVPKREDPRDVLVLNKEINSIDSIPKKFVVGTSSKKRSALVKEEISDIEVLPIRGNVDERLKKIDDNLYGGVVLAAAGLHRLNLRKRINYYFNPKKFIPAPAQGILGIQIRKDDKSLLKMINKISDKKANIQNKAERNFYKFSNEEYEIVGAYCSVEGDFIELFGMLGNNTRYLKKSLIGKIGEEEYIAKKLYEEIKKELINEK